MKKIVFIIVALFIAIVTMAYLYFSGLNFEQKNSQHSLYAAAANSSLIFSFENDQAVLDILKSQELLQEIIGEEKFKQVATLYGATLALPDIQKLVENQNVYISLFPNANRSIDFLYSTQINPDFKADQLMKVLATTNLSVKSDGPLFRLLLNDTTEVFAGTKDNLLLLSTDRKLVDAGLKVPVNQSDDFAEFIKVNNRTAKNSVAEVYINFETLPKLLKATMPGRLSGDLSPLNNQKAYAALVYNYSNEKILLTGVTALQNQDNYYQLFTNLKPQNISIPNLLPENTANYTAFSIENYSLFRKGLKEWFKNNKKDGTVASTIASINTTYRIDFEKVLPTYLKDQLITFQLSTSEKLGAISLSNGDKFGQQLLEMSATHSEDIKQLKVDNLLYCLYGEALVDFKKPYYMILDNYMIFSNHPGTLTSFLVSYVENKLLINTANYNYAIGQLPSSSSIHFYMDMKNSSKIIQQNLYLPFFRHINSTNGMGSFSSISYQLSSDNHKFLSNFLMVKKEKKVLTDSLSIVPQDEN